MTYFADADNDNTKQELSETGREIGIESDDNDDNDDIQPFDPSKIAIEQKAVPMDTILRRLKQGTIILSPSFQRKEVWNITKKSRLIESIMLNIPLPMFYVAADEQGKWEVVDGLQRLSAIRDYLHGDKNGVFLKLQNLEFLSKRFDNKTFKAIEDNPEDQKIVNTLLETEMRFTIINPGTPEAVKRNIFKRINTGGMPLTSQEIRHALYEGKSSELLQKLVASNEFIQAITIKIDDSRMGASELILRMIAFMIMDRSAYKTGMDTWLSNAMQVLNFFPNLNKDQINKIFKDTEIPKLKITSLDEINNKFCLAMTRAKELFGHHAFRKSLPNETRKTPINKSLFEVWGNILAEMSENNFIALVKNQDELFNKYEELMKEREFVNSISRHSSSQKGVMQSYQNISELVNQVIGINHD